MSLTVHPDIAQYEKQWVLLHNFLRQKGYQTRARYQPGWVPSWETKRLRDVMTCRYEDGEPSKGRQLDAIRTSDGAEVMLKIVETNVDPSPQHARYFAEEPRGSDSRNHCLPLLDVLHPPAYPGSMILVSPRCVPWNVWPFSRVSEAVDFLTHVLEGLAFMHENSFVHLDASSGNIVMDGLHLYSEPCHPMRPETVLNDLKPAKHIERYQSDRPVRYYFIDFETSLRFPSVDDRRLVKRTLGQDKSVPEERAPDSAPVDPFALDVYCLGNVIVQHWLKAYRNVEFVRQLAEDMVSQEPAARPTAQQALDRFIAIRDALSPAELKRPLVQIPIYHSVEAQVKALQPVIKKWKAARKQEEARRKAALAAEKPEQRPIWRGVKDLFSVLASKSSSQVAPPLPAGATSSRA